MADILHDFPLNVSPQRVFEALATPHGLDTWWTLTSAGAPQLGNEYVLNFGPGYIWRAVVTKCVPNEIFELQMTHADQDWTGSRVGFTLENKHGVTWLRFYHLGWPEANAHYRQSSYCWAMYMRVMKRNLEAGEFVPYEKRLDV